MTDKYLKKCDYCEDYYRCTPHDCPPTCPKDECYQKAVADGSIGFIHGLTEQSKSYDSPIIVKINNHSLGSKNDR